MLIYKWLSAGDSFWVRAGDLCPLLLSALGLHLGQQTPGGLRHATSVFVGSYQSCWCRGLVFWVSPITPLLPYLLWGSLCLGRRDLMEIPHLDLSVLRSLSLCTLSGSGPLYIWPHKSLGCCLWFLVTQPVSGFQLKKWASSQVSYWLVTPKLCTIIALAYLAGGNMKRVCVWLGLHFSFGSRACTFLYQRCSNMGLS